MTNTHIIEKRQDTETRREFDRAFDDLSVLLTGYNKTDHFSVTIGFLNAYGLLKGKDSAKGRLLIKLEN